MRIHYVFNTQYGDFSDTIILEDGVTMTEEEIEAEKQRRFSNWISVIESHSEIADASPDRVESETQEVLGV